MPARPIIAMLLLAAALLLPPAQATAEEPRLIAGTTIIADIVHDIRPDAQIRTLIPGGSCPGHYDLRPGDMRLLHDAQATILHDWQTGQGGIRALIEATQGGSMRVIPIATPGNPMTPQTQELCTLAVAEALASLAPERREDLLLAAARRNDSTRDTAAQLLAHFAKAGASETPVVCSDMQAPFVRWAGFSIAATYGRPADMTPDQLARVIDAGRAASARLVIDNLQSGGGGEAIAEELGARHVVLSNFPDAFPDTPTWAATITANAERLLTALSAQRSTK
ncbi:zinc transport system substrate-binding protein [Desulfobaculum xiamenense]|uniref:Zinc transport system substrate-binding protein n=1 Tax=Desulfobaculum xiamenense TaxID=995050 RepID=A0A846QHU4_9BACT|nr:zinc ABC transporter substrate-binding protein [Desulfobaculum xiamenense]NJB66597.1 zinc transport system substrate-binding protein [Desulfobaculum xiamenense]